MPVLGFIELIFIGCFFLLMVIGTALDRRNIEGPKWWFLGLGLLLVVMYYWSDITFTSLWATVGTWQFWQPAVVYLVAGLLYSAVEFVFSVRKMAARHRDSWAKFIQQKDETYVTEDGQEVPAGWVGTDDRGETFYTMMQTRGNGVQTKNGEVRRDVKRIRKTYREMLLEGQKVDATDAQKDKAARVLASYSESNSHHMSDLRKDFVKLELSKGLGEVSVSINRGRLADFIASWTLLWPAYGVSLVLGDFVIEAFRMVGDFFATLGGRFVKLTFADVFKV